jgi:small-conductance mechanosensitive channel
METINFASASRDAFVSSLQGLWFQVGLFLPKILGALVILIIGLVIAAVLGGIVRRLVAYTRIDDLFDKLEARANLHKMGINFNLAALTGWFVKWFIIIATLITVADTLGLQQITLFLQQVVLYIPNVIVAIAILTIGMVAGQFVSTLISDALKASPVTARNSAAMGKIAKYAIIVFAFMAALLQLGIAPQLIQILFAGLVLTLTLAFGLGGREQAAKYIARLADNQNRPQ